MIVIKYFEHFSQDSPDKYVFYTHREFFEFWKKNYKNGSIDLISDDGMEVGV